MLIDIESLFRTGAVQHLYQVVHDVVHISVEAMKSILDLPVDVNSLESLIRFVKTSGFEDENALSAIRSADQIFRLPEPGAAPGLTIGGGSLRVKPPSSSTSESGRRDHSAPAAASTAYAKTNGSSGFATVVPRAMLVFLLFDILLMVLAKQSSLNACVSKLGIVQWVVGGIFLGFPTTLLVDSVRHEYSFRSAFVTELIMLMGSFIWLCYGGSMVFNAVSACVDTIAPLWWLSYASSVLSLSVAGTVIFCMVVTTVLSLIYGSTQSQ